MSRSHSAAEWARQMIVFEATFVTLAFVNAFGYALLAARARRLMRAPGAIALVNRLGGAALIGAGAAAALAPARS